jgi:hypothetical protein
MILGRVGKVFNFRAHGVVQVIGKCEAPNSNLCTTKKILILLSEKQTLKTNEHIILLNVYKVL